MSKPNTKQSEVQTVAEAERTIAALEGKATALQRQREADDAERSHLAFVALTERANSEATKQLAALTERALRRDRELGDIDAALITARQRLQQAQLAHAKAEDREQAKKLRKAVEYFLKAGTAVDGALSALAHNGAALQEALQQIHALGCQFPTSQQLDSLGHIALRSSLMRTPWARSVETVQPGQRRSFRSLVETWAANIEINHIKPRLNEQTKTEAA